jgi:hypothetical protein
MCERKEAKKKPWGLAAAVAVKKVSHVNSWQQQQQQQQNLEPCQKQRREAHLPQHLSIMRSVSRCN